jgi:hypothetical protein
MKRLWPLVLSAILITGCSDTRPVTGDLPDAGISDDAESSVDGTTLADGEVNTVDGPPWANVYPINPLEDNKTTSKVELKYLNDAEGYLTGLYANTYNCLNNDKGDKISVDFGGMAFTGKMCEIVKVAQMGADGSFLHITPSTDVDPDDTFAEVMMYHHVTMAHDLFKERLGLTHMDKPLRSIVNLQAFVDLMNNWMGMVNAAFVPAQSGNLFASFGVDLNKGEDAIIFIQGPDRDTAYDATVIYHEYTHAMIGMALQGKATTKYGIDPSPGGLNEGLADYFAASFTGNSTVGGYALGGVNGQRDLERDFSCPNHVVGEVHQDGEIAGGVLWDYRAMVGTDIADKTVANAVLTFTATTNFELAAEAILDELKQLAPEKEAAARKLFEDRGMIGCVPVIDVTTSVPTGAIPQQYPGTATLTTQFKDGAPGYAQYRLKLAATTKELTIEFTPAEAGGGLIPGMPSAKGNVWVALKKGSEAISYDYSSGTGIGDYQAVLQGADDGAGTKLTVSGNCVTEGDLIFQFVSKSLYDGSLGAIKITQSDTVTNAAPNFDLCGE